MSIELATTACTVFPNLRMIMWPQKTETLLSHQKGEQVLLTPTFWIHSLWSLHVTFTSSIVWKGCQPWSICTAGYYKCKFSIVKLLTNFVLLCIQISEWIWILCEELHIVVDHVVRTGPLALIQTVKNRRYYKMEMMESKKVLRAGYLQYRPGGGMTNIYLLLTSTLASGRGSREGMFPQHQLFKGLGAQNWSSLHIKLYDIMWQRRSTP